MVTADEIPDPGEASNTRHLILDVGGLIGLVATIEKIGTMQVQVRQAEVREGEVGSA
jgi:hypothetical protein